MSGDAVFLEYLSRSEATRDALRRVRPGRALYAPSFAAALAVAGLVRARPDTRLILVPDGEQAASLAAELSVYVEAPVAVMPSRGVPWGSDVAPAPHVCGERQGGLAALAAGKLVVAEVAVALERFPPLSLLPPAMELWVGAEQPFELLLEDLVAQGYERVGQVRERGQFAVRGGMVDIYPSTGEPTRVELWGDQVDSLRRFSVFSQRTIAPVPSCTVFAAGEIDQRREDYRRNLEHFIDGLADAAGADGHGAYLEAEAAAAASGDLEASDVARRAGLRALEALSGSFVTLAQVAGGTGLLVVDPSEAARALTDAAAQAQSAVPQADERARFYEDPADVRAWLRDALAVETMQRDQRERLDAARPQVVGRQLSAAESELSRLVNDGYRTFIVFRHVGEAGRAAYRLKTLTAEVIEPAAGSEAGASVTPGASSTATGVAGGVSAMPPPPGTSRPRSAAPTSRLPDAPGLYFIAAPLREGFVSAQLKLAVIPERLLLRTAAREPRFVAGARLSSFFDLRLGDHVVHEDFGIARFAGIETKTVAGVTRDYLYLQFRGDDKLFLPHDQIAKVTRYIGAGAGAPALNSLSGTAWQAVRTRARRAVLEMAGELLELYAARQARPGCPFPPDGDLLRRLEEAFPYEETEDQAAAIDDVKNDMEAAWPMDRLVCGDVGYGKTEVALRAALKAAEGGKQTLMLVPTTILAQQHQSTFRERFVDLPVAVDMVSRFRTAAETRRVLREFRDGRVDVLVGTHRLLGRDVSPHDLGLVIIDEEQRFGVRQKESLRQLRLQVDVMSLTATPIPRTLQMSLSGIRDISVIETPPRGRHEIRTYIGEYRDDIVRAALEKELARGGQSFYLHNRVETIEEAAEHVRQLVPTARLLVAHGQMHEHKLEEVMTAFLAGEADVLVTTSIIESGIDIPTVNTLVVDRAEMLGLAQLYQIRGRIGRGEEHAYAYLLYPSEVHLSSEAVARLRTLSDHTELGAGFKIAMADLEIRGAGDLLGDEQSGHVAAVGFELYVQMLDEAVSELRGQPVAEQRAVRVDIPVSAYVPAEYIAFEATKVDVHRRIARARDRRELSELGEELGDRFGAPPEPVARLLALHAVRLLTAEAGATTVTWRAGRLTVDGLRLADEEAGRLREQAERTVYFKARESLTAHPPADLDKADGGGVLRWVQSILDAILSARNAPSDYPEKGDP